MSSETSVVHCKREPYDVYIGRPGPFGNPFPTGKDGNRDEVIRRFAAYARDRIQHDPDWAAAVRALHGKTLGCWCAPRPCHGEVLAVLAKELAEADETE